MTILRHSDYYNVVLETVKEHGRIHRRALRDEVAKRVGLSEEEKQATNSKGTNIFGSRIHWSSAVLVLAGLLRRPERAILEITPLGDQLLAKYPNGIPAEIVKEQDAFKAMEERARQNKLEKKSSEPSDELDDDQTPLEQLERAVSQVEQAVANDLLVLIQGLNPAALEKLMLTLLRKMGYGASEDSLQHIGGTGDEGLDGVVYQDKLGFHRIYIQAKRYKTGNNISTDTMNSFIGAIERKGGIGGVFVTTSDFTDGARKAATETPKHIALINGQKLSYLLIEHEIGVRFPKVFREVELDDSFFEELSE